MFVFFLVDHHGLVMFSLFAQETVVEWLFQWFNCLTIRNSFVFLLLNVFFGAQLSEVEFSETPAE